jgi:hypothetical protein
MARLARLLHASILAAASLQLGCGGSAPSTETSLEDGGSSRGTSDGAANLNDSGDRSDSPSAFDTGTRSDAGSAIDTGGAGEASSSSDSSTAPQITLLSSAGAVVAVSPTTYSDDNSEWISWNATNATSCTASGAWSGTKAVFGGCKGSSSTSASSSSCLTTSTAYNTGSFVYSETGSNEHSYTLTCTGPGGMSTASTTITVFAPATTPDLTGKCGGTSDDVAWVYHNGVFTWPGDFTGTGTALDYQDNTGSPLSGPYDILFTATSQWAEWLPFSQNWDLYIGGCNYLTFAIKPKVTSASWQTYFMMVGDVMEAKNSDGTTSSTNYLMIGSGPNTSMNSQTHATTSISSYGPSSPVTGAWNVYKIPLSVYFNGEVPASIYKFAIQDESGSTDSWYIDEVGFTGK